MTLAPLVELLRIKHDPLRHNWGNRYLHRTFPAADSTLLQSLMYVAAPEELPAKRAAAAAWFETLATELERRSQLVPPA
jgi:hypothetical protein